MVKEQFRLASNNLRRRKLRSWLTILGIFIGIAAVVSLISLGDGLRKAVLGQFNELGSDKLAVQNSGTGYGPPGSTSVQKLTSHDVEVIKRVNGVDLVVPRLIRQVEVEYNDISQFKYAASMPDDREKIQLIYEVMNLKPQSGSLIQAGETGKVDLGNDFSKDVDFGKALRVDSKITIQGKDFKVKGLLSKSSSLIINGVILIPEKDLKRILNIDDEEDIIAVKIKSGADIEKVAADIKRALRQDRHEKEGEEDFSVTTPVQALNTVNVILVIINLIVTGIASISLLVGGIGIANTMYTSVLERTKEIGVMKAIGARNSDILQIFLLEAGLLGLVGGLTGALIGLGGAILVSTIASQFMGSNIFVVSISWPLLIFAVSFAFLLGIFFGVTPAIQASRLRPVEALRSYK